jgi:hypothetical protein
MAAAGAACIVPACGAAGSSRERNGLLAMLRVGPARSGIGNHRWATIESGYITGELLRGVASAGRVDWHVDPATGAAEVALRCRVVDARGSGWILTDASCPSGVGSDPPGGVLHSAPRLVRESDPGRRHEVLVGRIDPRRFSQGWLELHAFERT